MKQFLKIFSIAMVVFMVIAGVQVYSIYQNILGYNNRVPSYDENWLSDYENDLVTLESYEAYISEGNRINFLIVGLEDVRTDTIILASYNIKSKKLDMISIPRDTYYYKEGFRSGYTYVANYKINAVYSGNGIEGLIRAVEDIVNIPIHHYITVTMTGAAKTVDAMGGVEFDVPFDMVYDDIYDSPPLHINLKAGEQVLDGENAVDFLRFRKNNDGTISYGDIQRIEQQQKFLAAAARQAIGIRFPLVVKEVFDAMETDVKLSEALTYATSTLGMKTEDINFYTLPGDDEYMQGVSFYMMNGMKIQKIIYEIYNIPFEKAGNN
ncbi:MAG: LCP family protein [Dethiosulfatibacter sp.]|nr:LCP family protein [Dethiosulfatibacter sp.]